MSATSAEGSWGLAWTYAGVDFSISGTGGDDCVKFIPPAQKIYETILTCLLAAAEIAYAYPKLKLPQTVPQMNRVDPWGKRVLLVALCITYGIELGYKFSTEQVIWIFNPCHVTTMLQIFLLMAPPSKFVMMMFRLSMHMFHGAAIAVVLPVVNTRQLPLEVFIYWLQHALILVIPLYLIYHGGVFTPEPLSDFSWAIMSKGILFLYHWVILQSVSQVSKVNLNNSVCPAVSDPFYGPFYRQVAVVHSGILILLFGKVYTAVAIYFLPKKQMTDDSVNGGSLLNGHVKFS